jgi:excisionase family DNA binding protein
MTMSIRTHTTVSGHRVEYHPTPKVSSFLERLDALLTDPKVTEQQLIGVAYSPENPILDATFHPGRGMVTRAVLDDPAYEVMVDLLFRKRMAEDGISAEKLASRYSMTVAEAAANLGIHESAVRQAISAKRLASWIKEGGRHYVDPRALKALEVGTRGPVGPRKPKAL